MERFIAGISYDGFGFHGWQKLKDGLPTIQEYIESAISTVANESVQVVCAGRTDAGVHAVNQIIHFDTDAKRPLYKWLRGINRYCPSGISMNWIYPINDDFHARFNAKWRQYCYVILNHPVHLGLYQRRATWIPNTLDVNQMIEGARFLVGTHDFSAFRAAHCQAVSPIRTIYNLQFQYFKPLILMHIKANAFLHHMVRNIIGTLIAVGQNKQPSTWVAEVLKQKDRASAGITAPAQGLYFIDAGYDASVPKQDYTQILTQLGIYLE